MDLRCLFIVGGSKSCHTFIQSCHICMSYAARMNGNWEANVLMDLRCLFIVGSIESCHTFIQSCHICMSYAAHMNGNWEAEIRMNLRCLFIVDSIVLRQISMSDITRMNDSSCM